MSGNPLVGYTKWELIKLLCWYIPVVMPYESVRDAVKAKIAKRKKED
jgi:hypothetical protein